MKRIKNCVIWLLVIAMLAVSMLSACNKAPTAPATGPAAQSYTPGTYTATATGNGGDVPVSVTFSKNAITSIEVGDNNETKGIGDNAIKKIPSAIIKGQTLSVDSVSGATHTSNAILTAVEDCVVQAGGNVDLLKAASDKKEAVGKQIALEADIAVVGAGVSGLTAAVEAAESGFSVVLIEKKDYLGGMVTGTEGVFGYGSKMQADAGVKLPPISSLIDEEMAYTNYRSDPLLWKDMITASGADIDWLIDHGVEFDKVDTYEDTSLFKCFHWWPNRGGASYAEAMSAAVKKLGVNVLVNTPANKLITENGAVTGVKAKNSDTNDEYTIKAKSVILCTGGLSNNPELMSKMTGQDTTDTMSQSMSVGDGLRMATEVGAGTTPVCALNFPYVYGYDIMNPDTDDLFIGTAFQCLPVINQDGKRFFAEDVFAKYFCALYLNALSSQKASYVLVDQNTIDRFETGEGVGHGFVFTRKGDHLANYGALLEDAVTNGHGHVLKGATLGDLAKAIGANPKTLEETVARYNEFAKKGVDEDFGKNADDLYVIGDGPYYAVQLCRYYVTSIGGIDIDIDNRVVNEKGDAIPGLYSAGVDSCKLYQETYNYQLSGGMMAYNIYSGRNAVQTICQDLK